MVDIYGRDEMKKFLFSSFMLVLGLAVTSDADAARTMRRGGTTTTSSSRGSSSNIQDISSFTRRFSEESEKYSSRLFYGKKYPLSEFLFYNVASYYKTNGSEGLNEKLCFGPFMNLTGVSTGGDVVTYTSDEETSCQTLLPDYTYSLELKEATTGKLKNLQDRALRVTKQDVSISWMELDCEPYVDVEDFVTKIGSVVNEAKKSCQAFYSDMENVKEKLGWTTVSSVVGTALSATATGLGVQNVKKTDQVKRNEARLEELKQYNEEDLEKIDELYKNVEDKKASMESKANVLSTLSYSDMEADYESIKDVKVENCEEECVAVMKKYGYNVDESNLKNLKNELEDKKNVIERQIESNIQKYQNASDEYNDALSKYNNTAEKARLMDYNATTQTTQKVVDWVQAGANAASGLVSIVSIANSAGAFNSLKSAISNLEKCQKSISDLNTLYNQYNVESVNYGD